MNSRKKSSRPQSRGGRNRGRQSKQLRTSVAVNDQTIAVGQQFEVELQSMTLEGQSIARLDGYVLFVSGGIPGETAKIEMTSVGAKFGRARVVDVEEPAESRNKPACRHFGRCGSCQWQHMAYDEQLAWKEELLRATLAHRLPRLKLPIRPTIGVPEPWGTRHKIHYSIVEFGKGRTSNLHLCHHRENSPELEQIHECPVHHPEGDAIARRAFQWLRDRGVSAAKPHLREAGLKSILVRTSGTGAESHIVIVATGELPQSAAGIEQAMLGLQGVTGVHLNIQPDVASTYIGDATRCLAGNARLIEPVGGIDFHVSPTVFFQTNAFVAEELSKLVRQHIPDKGAGSILDLYSGVGLFSLPLAAAGHEVTAVEENPASIADGLETAKRNQVTRCRFVESRVQTFLKKLPRDQKFGTVILDPPRDGCPDWAMKILARGLRPRRIINVSCNPQALAVDLEVLTESGYRVREIQPLDMFPHTAHIESVTLLERKKDSAPGYRRGQRKQSTRRNRN